MKLNNPSNVLTILFILLIHNVAGLESENMIGGTRAMKSQFPYHVFIQSNKEPICGGALVAPDVVLTAAHCVSNNTSENFLDRPYVVVAGAVDEKDRNYNISVTKVYIHKHFKITYTDILHDIALLRLAKKFDVSGRLPIRLINLPLKNEKFVGKTAIVTGSGWDKISEYIDPKTLEKKYNGASEEKLKYAFVKIINSESCKANLVCGRVVRMQSKIIESICQGDSGSPLVYLNKVIGVVSHGPGNCDDSNLHNSYIQVSDYIDFINSAINDRSMGDMLVKQVSNYKTFIVPFLKLEVTTKSIRLEGLIKQLLIEEAKWTSEQEKLNQLNKELNEISDKLNELAASNKYDTQDYFDKYQSYMTKNIEHDIKKKEVNELYNSVYHLGNRVNSLLSTEAFFKYYE